MGLIVSRWSSMLSVAAVLVLITASGCKMSSWSMPGMGWLNGGSNETTPQASANQPATSAQAVPSNSAAKYLNPPTISTGTPSNYSQPTANTKTSSSGRTTAYNGRNTIGPYHPPKSKTVATTQPAAATVNPQYNKTSPYSQAQYPTTQYPANGYRTAQNPAAQYPATQYPATQAPATQYPATQYPATQAPATQYPATQYPATQYPATQYPATQYPATQAPATQYPATQYPATQAPATQYPATNPKAGSAYPTKTADTRNNDSTGGNYQGGFYAPERTPAATLPSQKAPAYSNPQLDSPGQGAASTYSPTAPAQISSKPDFALPVTPGATTDTAQQAPYGINTDPYAGKTQSPADPAVQFPTQSSPPAYRPGSTGRLDPTSVPQQESYPTRSSQFNAYGN